MFGWLTGGSSAVKVNPDQDSKAQPGKKCCVSDPIEDLDLDKFAAQFWKWVTDKPKISQYQTGSDFSGTKETGMTEAASIEVSGLAALLVQMKATFYVKYSQEGDEFYVDAYVADKSMTKLSSRTTYKFLPDPSRVEILNEDFGVRKAGPMVKGLLQDDLQKSGFPVAVEMEQDSPSMPGEQSCLSAPIDGELTTEGLWAKIKELRLAAGGEEQADGSIKQAFSGWIGATTYSTHKFDKEKDEIVMHDFLDDGNYEDCKFVVYTKVTQDPVRVERWSMPKPEVTAGAKYANDVGSKTLNAMLDMQI